MENPNDFAVWKYIAKVSCIEINRNFGNQEFILLLVIDLRILFIFTIFSLPITLKYIIIIIKKILLRHFHKTFSYTDMYFFVCV